MFTPCERINTQQNKKNYKQKSNTQNSFIHMKIKRKIIADIYWKQIYIRLIYNTTRIKKKQKKNCVDVVTFRIWKIACSRPF